uniref:Ground-like domain-containing protein n=1 Tax=Syphacia muris TaxID=451379 RepID=A0A0N5AML0_9BILA
MFQRKFNVFLLSLLYFGSKHLCVQSVRPTTLPCAALIHQYPLSSPSVNSDTDDFAQHSESSGYEPPIYDEFIATVSPFNFSAKPVDKLFSLKNCSNINSTCSFNDTNYVIDIDDTLSLAFCEPVKQTLLRDCQNTDELIRVVGAIHNSGEALTSVQQIFIFCKCDRKYRRTDVELWTDGLYAFVYKCA